VAQSEQAARYWESREQTNTQKDDAMADVLIAGGGVAGSALAIMLGRRGVRVDLFERSTFPREKPCGEGLMPAGVAVLERLGLAEAVGGAPFYGVRYHVGESTLEGRFPRAAGMPDSGRGQRRRRLDQVLFETAAKTPGVKAHTGVHVEAPLVENGRVAGLLVEDQPVRARLVVAADGANSRVRRRLGLDATSSRKRFGVREHYRLAEGQHQPPWVDVLLGAGCELYVTPLPGREVLVAALTDVPCGGEAIHDRFHRWISAQPLLASRLEGAEPVCRVMGTTWLNGIVRPGVLPGAVLLGDAAGSIDPISGGGMTHALLTAELLAGYIQDWLGTSDDWLIRFDSERRALLADFRRITRMLLWLADHPRLAAVALSAGRRSPLVVSHLMGVAAGTRRLFVPTANRFERLAYPSRESASSTMDAQRF